MALGLDDSLAGWGPSAQHVDLLAQLGASSPFEIEINGNDTHSGL